MSISKPIPKRVQLNENLITIAEPPNKNIEDLTQALQQTINTNKNETFLLFMTLGSIFTQKNAMQISTQSTTAPAILTRKPKYFTGTQIECSL